MAGHLSASSSQFLLGSAISMGPFLQLCNALCVDGGPYAVSSVLQKISLLPLPEGLMDAPLQTQFLLALPSSSLDTPLYFVDRPSFSLDGCSSWPSSVLDGSPIFYGMVLNSAFREPICLFINSSMAFRNYVICSVVSSISMV
jgi:hypothetical protein